MGEVVHAVSNNVRIIFGIFFPNRSMMSPSATAATITRLPNFQPGWLFPRLLLPSAIPEAEPVGRQRPIHMPIAMTIADNAMIVRSIVSHDGICVEGCSSIALRLYPIISLSWAAQANVRQITRGQAFLRDPIAQRDLIRGEPPPTRHRRR